MVQGNRSQPGYLEKLAVRIESHLDLENQVLDRLEGELALPLSGRVTPPHEVQDRISRVMELQRTLSTARSSLQAVFEQEGLASADGALGSAIEVVSSMTQFSLLRSKLLMTHQRCQGMKQTLFRLHRIVEEANRICVSYLDAMTGEERGCRYGADGRVSISQGTTVDASPIVARAG